MGAVENKEGVPAPINPMPAASFAHHNGDGVLRHGEK